MRETQNLNVLIVDDSVADSFLIGEFLDEIKDVNYTYNHCESFTEAKEVLSSSTFDLVLLDLHLPDTNGIKHIEELNHHNGHIPLIILTGMADKSISLYALKNGANDYLIKGEFDSKLLQRSIEYAIERKRMEEESMSQIIVAQEKEKQRIARDVHDSLGQNLTSAIIHLQNLKEQLKSAKNEVKELIEISIKCINEAIAESRGISRNLMPQSIHKFGLESGIESMLYLSFTKRELKLEFESNLGEQRFEHQIELTFFRVAQEAFNNVLKYSKAKKVLVSLHQFNENLVLVVADDGCGFNVEQDENQKGIGLSSMRIRARLIAADLSIESAPNFGTLVRMSYKYNKEKVIYN